MFAMGGSHGWYWQQLVPRQRVQVWTAFGSGFLSCLLRIVVAVSCGGMSKLKEERETGEESGQKTWINSRERLERMGE